VIWMGAVSDFSSLIMSVRSKGDSISKISGDEISKKMQLYFSIFLWISLILVIAVFSIFAAKTFIEEPDAVLPSVGLIPLAVLVGWLLYVKQYSNAWVTGGGVIAVLLLLVWGKILPLSLPAFAGLSSQDLWIVLLLIYCFMASVLPVQILLQPRDYLASFILFGMIALGVAGVFVTRPDLQIPAVTQFRPSGWPQAGPLWPMLFVTIACGAISGFHALVSSGTTCKQIASETHACRIGYGGMLVEALVGILVLICVSAGLNSESLRGLIIQGGPISAFGQGYQNITQPILGGYGKTFAILALNAFILTTLDTAARITRYITSELFGIKNKYAATGVVVAASGALAFSGKWAILWPAFGAANQLIAGMTLLVGSCWLLRRGKKSRIALFPAFFMILTTTAAFLYQIYRAVTAVNHGGVRTPDWGLAAVASFLVVLASLVLSETVPVILSTRRQREGKNHA